MPERAIGEEPLDIDAEQRTPRLMTPSPSSPASDHRYGCVAFKRADALFVACEDAKRDARNFQLAGWRR
jgi:hypothetical protein